MSDIRVVFYDVFLLRIFSTIDIYEDLNLDALLSSAVVAIPAAFDLSPRSSTAATADAGSGAAAAEPSSSTSSTTAADASAVPASDKISSSGSDGVDSTPGQAPAAAKKGTTITSIIGSIFNLSF